MPVLSSASSVVEQYDGFLLDAYGVLIASEGVVPGAPEFLKLLRKAGKPFVVVTNDASRSRERSSASYRERGIDVDADRIVTAGSLLGAAGLSGARCTVLGTRDARDYVTEAGAELVPAGDDADVVVVADDAGYEFLRTMDDVLSMIVRRTRAGGSVRLVLPNPDLVYPKRDGHFGMASGAIMAMLTSALSAVLGADAPLAEPLGKPHSPIFEAGMTLLGTAAHRTLMIGDQLETDVRGALAFGLDAALVLTGVARATASDVQPTWVIERLTTQRESEAWTSSQRFARHGKRCPGSREVRGCSAR